MGCPHFSQKTNVCVCVWCVCVLLSHAGVGTVLVPRSLGFPAGLSVLSVSRQVCMYVCMYVSVYVCFRFCWVRLQRPEYSPAHGELHHGQPGSGAAQLRLELGVIPDHLHPDHDSNTRGTNRWLALLIASNRSDWSKITEGFGAARRFSRITLPV